MISFPEVPEGNEENEGDQILMFDKQTLPFQIFQTRPLESLIFIRYCINDNNFIPGPAEKEISQARRKPVSLTFLKKSNHPVNVRFKEGHLQDDCFIVEDIYV
jgi:hypothetical protein